MGGEVGRGMDVEAFPRLEALADGILMLNCTISGVRGSTHALPPVRVCVPDGLQW